MGNAPHGFKVLPAHIVRMLLHLAWIMNISLKKREAEFLDMSGTAPHSSSSLTSKIIGNTLDLSPKAEKLFGLQDLLPLVICCVALCNISRPAIVVLSLGAVQFKTEVPAVFLPSSSTCSLVPIVLANTWVHLTAFAFFFFGMHSFRWFLFRTPCQQAT